MTYAFGTSGMCFITLAYQLHQIYIWGVFTYLELAPLALGATVSGLSMSPNWHLERRELCQIIRAAMNFSTYQTSISRGLA
jgi:hypothetical protein